MPDLEGRKRLQPKMARGSWRLSIGAAGLQVVCFSALALLRINAENGWDVAALSIFSVGALMNVVWFFYLLRVRRNDLPFWDEEEAHRADWERRGRQL